MARALLIIGCLLIAGVSLAGVARDSLSSLLPRDRGGGHLPQLGAKWMTSAAYANFEQEFNQKFLLRKQLRTGKAWIDYHIFRSSTVQEVYVGRAGWLYFRSELDDFRKDSCSHAGEMEVLARQLQEVDHIVRASGRTFVFLVAPNKSTIYPEHVDIVRSRGCFKSRYDLLLEAIGRYPLSHFLRLDDLLLAAKKEKQVYFKMDTHWNDEGVLIVIDALLRQLDFAMDNGMFNGLQKTTQPRRGDLAFMMGLQAYEVAPYVRLNLDEVSRSSEPSTPESPVSHLRTEPVGFDGQRMLLPGAVIYRDSFLENPMRFVEQVFSQIDAYWTQGGIDTHGIYLPMRGSEEALRGSRIVIFETVERHLPFIKVDPKRFREVLGVS